MALRPLELKAKNGTVLLGFLCVFPSLAQSVWSGSNDEKGKCLNISKGPMALCLCLAAGASVNSSLRRFLHAYLVAQTGKAWRAVLET